MFSPFDYAVIGSAILIFGVVAFTMIFGWVQWTYDRESGEVRRRFKLRKGRKAVEVILAATVVIVFFALMATAMAEFESPVDESWRPEDNDYGAIVPIGYFLVAGAYASICLKIFGITSQWSRDWAQERYDRDVEAADRRHAGRLRVPNYVIEKGAGREISGDEGELELWPKE